MNSTESLPGLVRVLAAACAMFTLAGCAFGNHGTLVARRTVVRGAEILDIYAFGALLRPFGTDRGLSFGYRHASYLYPRFLDATPEVRATQWSWFHAPLPMNAPLLRANTTLGLEAQLSPEIKRCTLGYISQVLTVGGSPDESRFVKLHYARARPLETTLEYHEGD